MEKTVKYNIQLQNWKPFHVYVLDQTKLYLKCCFSTSQAIPVLPVCLSEYSFCLVWETCGRIGTKVSVWTSHLQEYFQHSRTPIYVVYNSQLLRPSLHGALVLGWKGQETSSCFLSFFLFSYFLVFFYKFYKLRTRIPYLHILENQRKLNQKSANIFWQVREMCR